MASLSLSGLASGMDWKTTVSQLMAIERVPQDRLKAQQAADQKLQSAYDTLKSNLSSFYSAATGLNVGVSSASRVANISAGLPTTNVSGATVSTSSGAAIGTYSVAVTSLAKPSVAIGTSVLFPKNSDAQSKKLSEYGISEGTFTVNNIRYTLSASDITNKSLSDIFKPTGLVLTPTGGVTPTTDSSVTSAFSQGALQVSGASSMGASGDTSNIMSVLGLKYDGSKYVQTISASVLSKFQLDQFNSAAVGSDSLTINGVSIGTFSGTDTLGSVISRINSSSAGVTATIDPDSQRLRLTANTLGSTAITVSDSASGTGLVSKLGLGNAPTLGAGVVFQITPPDGTPISGSSNSNMIDFSAYGFGGTSMSVTGTGTFNVQVSASAGDYKSKINSLISAYNNLKQMVEASTKITVDASGKVSASVFSNRSDINTLLSSIRSKVYTAVEDPSVSSGATNASYSGLSASYNTMGKIGIGFDSNGQMVISDSAKLDSVLATNPGAVDALLNSGNGGISLDIIAGAPPSSNQIAVTNPNLKVGQAISAAWLPSGTKITAVSGGAGTYTVTLSNAILGTYDGAGAKYTPPTSAMGVGVRLSTFLSNLTGTSGLVATATSSLTGQVKRLQNQIDALDRSLALKEKQLTNSFIAMESAQSKFQNMSSQITAAFK